MGSLQLSKTNRLYWLGRYVERAFTTIECMEVAYDEALDGPSFDYHAWCDRLEIPCSYESEQDFFERYLFDADDPFSVIASLDRAFDNAVVLRETITSKTLAYIQLAKNVMDNAKVSSAPMLDLQSVKDYLMAFKGCVDEYVADEDNRVVIKCGFTVERIDLCVRLGIRTGELAKEFGRLVSRLQRTKMERDGARLQLLLVLAPAPDPVANKKILLDCVENLFPDA